MTRSKPDLYIRWSKRERALVYGGTCKPTAGFIAHIVESVLLGEMHGNLCGEECKRNGIKARLRKTAHQVFREQDVRTLAKELEHRGFDLTTLRFSVRKAVRGADATIEEHGKTCQGEKR